MEAARFIISGRVQGVGFRWATQAAGQELGLRGWVKNLPSGQVEAFAQGTAWELDQLEKWLHQGPPSSRVTTVDRETVDTNPEVTDFSIRR